MLQDYFKDNVNVVSCYVKKGNECITSINWDIFSHSDADSFIEFYTKETTETLKLKFKKKETEKSIYKIKNIFRCYHDTRYEGTKDIVLAHRHNHRNNSLEALSFKMLSDEVR